MLLQKNADCSLEHAKSYMTKATPSCQDILWKLLSKEPEERPTAKEALLHPWFSEDMDVLKGLLQYNNIVCS